MAGVQAHRVRKQSGGGNVVFLYDEEHRAPLAAAKLELYEGYSPAEAMAEAKLAQVARDGLLVVYEKLQDDPLDLEVVVGPVTSPRSTKKVKWQEPQQAFLRLPSGRLCIDDHENLRLRSGAARRSGVCLDVEPGDYVVTLHRLDLLAMDEVPEGLPSERVSLTPLGKKKRPTKLPPMLVVEGAEETLTVPPGEVVRNEFRGFARVWMDDASLLLNLDEAAAKRLDLRSGVGFELEVPQLGLTLRGFFLGAQVSEARAALTAWAKRRQGIEEFAEAQWMSGTDFDRRLLVLQRTAMKKRVAKKDWERWCPAKLVLDR